MPPRPSPTPTVPDSASASHFGLEFALVTVAAICSIILSVLRPPRATSPQYNPLSSFSLTIFLAVLASVGAFCVAFASFILGYIQYISFDALTGVLFGLIPALVSLPPQHLFLHWYYARRMRTRRSLDVRTNGFRYVRYSYACGKDPCARSWSNAFGGICKRTECTVSMYIRILPSSKSWFPKFDHSVALVDQADKRTILPQNSDKQLNGIRIGHTPNFVVLRDTDHRLTAWWWAAIRSSGARLVDNPALVQLDDRERVLNGLALVADIVVIAPMLQRYDTFFASLLRNDRKVQWSLSGLEGIVCNSMMDELGFDAWGRISSDMQRRNYVFEREDRRRVVLFVLAVYSNLFSPPTGPKKQNAVNQRISAQEILDRLIDDGNSSEVDFSKLCKELVENWLCAWGCPRDKLEQFNMANKISIPFRR